jgi:2-methylisocitrate lyase-like PEP mutase family enzyme
MTELSERFLALHHGDGPLLVPNPWDLGSARLFAHLGFTALATTSSGLAMTMGRVDGQVTRDEAIAHAGAVSVGTGLPVTGDLEDGFGADPAAVAETMRRAVAGGLAGASVEDFTRRADDPVYELELAVERVAAAAAAAGDAGGLVVTARAENYIKGRPDLADTIRRLQAYQEAGADVLYAPGLVERDDIAAVLSSVDRPVNVLCRPDGPTVAELGALGVHRISVGGSLAFTGLQAVAEAARELRDQGTYGFLARAAEGSKLAREAFRA